MAAPIARPRRAPAGFEEFWRAAYRRLLAAVMYAGAAEDVGHDAVAAAMEEVLRRWDSIDDHFAYARRAVVTHFIRDEMGPRRVAGRVIARGAVAGEYEDSRLTLWEDSQWVGQLLASLPPAQRDVMALIVDEFGPAEVARLLGKNPAAVRQNLRAARRRLRLALSGEERPRPPAARTSTVTGVPSEETWRSFSAICPAWWTPGSPALRTPRWTSG